VNQATAIKVFATGEILRGLPLHELGDMVSAGLARWYTDVPANVVKDVPAVATGASAEPSAPSGSNELVGSEGGLALDPRVVNRMKLSDLQELAKARGLPVGKDATRKLLIAAILTPGAAPGKPPTSEDVSERSALTAFLEEE
jgi:hypothetical protein